MSAAFQHNQENKPPGSMIRRVWLTRSQEGNAEWKPAVEAAHYEVHSIATMQFEWLEGATSACLASVQASDWIVFSSPRGVQGFASLATRMSANQGVACVGDSTAATCTRLLRVPDLVTGDSHAAGLASELLAQTDWQVAALVGALKPRPELEERLKEAGKTVHRCPVYSTKSIALTTNEPAGPKWRAGDAVFVASPSAVEALCALGPLPTDVFWISIGPSTSAALRAAGLEVSGEAESRNPSGMLETLRKLEHDKTN